MLEVRHPHVRCYCAHVIQACPWECHSYGIPWETSQGMGWDSTHLYFP